MLAVGARLGSVRRLADTRNYSPSNSVTRSTEIQSLKVARSNELANAVPTISIGRFRLAQFEDSVQPLKVESKFRLSLTRGFCVTFRLSRFLLSFGRWQNFL